MLISPSKLPQHKILKKRTLNFETVKRTDGNLVLIMTDNQDEFTAVLKSKLFRPQQMISTFVPRLIKPMGRKPVRIDQKQIYREIRLETDGRVRMGRAVASSYAGKNLCYNIIPEFTETLKLAETIRPSKLSLQNYMRGYQEDLIEKVIDDISYEKNYLVFPMTTYIPNLRRQLVTAAATDDGIKPVVMFLKSLRQGNINHSAYRKVDGVMFYNPVADAMVYMDIHDPDLEKNLEQDILRIIRLNNFNNGSDKLGAEDLNPDEDIDAGESSPIDMEDRIENNKETIKNIVLSDIAKKIKADKLDDFEPTTKDEADLVLTIDRKIESYLRQPENLNKTLNDLVNDIENDNEIRARAVNYLETRKISVQKSTKFADAIERENEIINSVTELLPDDTAIEPEKFGVEGIPKGANESKLMAFDDEYNQKQAKKDMMSALTAFSSSEVFPMSLEDFKIEDTSDDFDQKQTIHARYRTDEGRTLSFVLDVPKIVDKKYLYLGGNKKAITKQLIRLPIVKTKADRVEITTNFNKVTMERTNGKLSRQNATFLKVLNDYKDSDTVKISLGSNSVVNAEFINDFEYEELAEQINKIETPDWTVYFNREQIAEEISMMNFDEGIVTDKMTPIAIPKNASDSFVYIEDSKIYQITADSEEGSISQINESMFDFLFQKVLKRSTSSLPQIGKSYQYTKMKIVGDWYPLFVVIGSVNGMRNILKRYEVEYKLSEKKISMPGYVEVKFADKYMYYRDTVKNTLLLNILYMMDTENYSFSDFDLERPYVDYLHDKMGMPQYVIKSTLALNLALMLDPITKEILHDMKYPENITDLLLLGNTMLTHNTFRAQNDMRNYRVRGNELVYAMMYELIAKAYLSYQKSKLNGKNNDSIELGFTMNGKKITGQRALTVQLLTAPNINDHSTLNPVLEAELASAVNQKGFKGVNLDSAFTLELRTYSDSMCGLLSANATPASGAVGITRSLSFDSKLGSTRGYIQEKNLAALTGYEVFSTTELLSPYTSTSADPPRQA